MWTTPGARRTAAAAAGAGLRVRTYGEGAGADLRLTELVESAAGTTLAGGAGRRPLGAGPVRVPVPGRHMALNSAAALLTGLELGLPAVGLVDGIGRFAGVRRRFELKGTVAGVTVYDDYAHHPTEVAAQLRAARDGGRAGPGAGRVPAAPLQPDGRLRRGLRDRARRWPTRSWCWTCTRRARTRCPA